MSNSSSDIALELTFGIELEFYIARFLDPNEIERVLEIRAEHGLESYEENIEDDDREHQARAELAIILQNSGIDTYQYDPYHFCTEIMDGIPKYGTEKWAVSSDDSLDSNPKKGELKNHITYASGAIQVLIPQVRQDLQYIAIEVQSRKLVLNIESLTEVMRAIDTIVHSTNSFVDSTCALHIHVGNQNHGFPLPTLQSFSTLICILEKQLNQLHPQPRLLNRYCVQNTTAFEPEDRTPARMTAKIHGFATVQDLVRFFTTDRRLRHIQPARFAECRYWCYNLSQLADDGFQTVEFRQHEATLHVKRIVPWILFCCLFIQIAHEMDAATLQSLVQRAEAEENGDIIGILHALRLPVLAGVYENMVYEHPEDLEIRDWFEGPHGLAYEFT